MNKLTFPHYVMIAVVLLVSLSLYFSWTSPLATAIRKGERINGIVLGTDWVDRARHSDTLMFVSYDPARRFLDVISIPRDTHFTPLGYNFRKINEVYAYHYRTKRNDDLACHEVQFAIEQLLTNRVNIPYYLQVDYGSFRKVIDLMGGITIDIDEPMNYDDNAGNLHIHFTPGRQHLNGKQSLEYVRYRGQAGDLGRVFRQQRFVKAVLARWKNPYVIMQVPHMIALSLNDIKTNASVWDIIAAAMELKDLRVRNIRLSQLPGTPHGTYWEIDKDNCTGLMNKVFPPQNTQPEEALRIRLDIWNASGRPGLAEEVTWMLRRKGYDVIDYGNFSTRQKKSLIKDLTGDLRSAQTISDILSCGEVITRYDEKRLVDISVILGEDCDIPITARRTR